MENDIEKTDKEPAPQAEAKRAKQGTKQDANEQRQKAEQEEVVGRHRNDGQKDHKGAR